jgi:hypothetical protein
MDTVDSLVQDVNGFQREFNNTINACRRLCFITRGRELQIAACETLTTVKKKAEQLKERAIANEHEDMANALLAFEETAKAFINELSMWIAIKEEDYAKAWDFLISAQTAATQAMHAHKIADPLEDYIARLSALEKHIFPNHGFLSLGAIVRKSECTICGQEYGTCDHLVGLPYMGKMCHRLISEYEVEEVSFVTNPANKHCRITSFTDDDGLKRDAFTLRVISDEPSPKEQHDMATFDKGPLPGQPITCDVTGRPRKIVTVTKDGIYAWCRACKTFHFIPREELLDVLLTEDEKQRLREPLK